MRILKYIKNKKLVFVGFFTKSIEVIFELLLPIFMAILIDNGLKPGGEISKAYLMVGVILVFTFAGYLTTVYSQWLSAKLGQEYAMSLRTALFDKIQDLSLEDTNDLSTSTLVNRITIDVNHMQNALSMTIRQASRAPAMIIGSLIALFILSPKVAYILLAGLPIVIFVLAIIMIKSMKEFQIFLKENDKLLTNVEDNVEGARMIRAFAQVEHEERRFEKQSKRLSKVLLRLSRITSLSSPFTTLTLNVLLVIMLYFGAFEVFNENISNAQLLQVINYTTQLTISLIGIMNLAIIYTRAYSSAIRINEVLDRKNTVLSEGDLKVDNKGAKIEFKNVSFKYESSGYVLKDINLTINPGELVGIVGLTGSGKTSLVDLLLRFYNTDEGEILINGINIKNYDLKDLRENIAYASQKASLLSGSIEENIFMNNKYSEKDKYLAIDNAQANFILEDEEKIVARLGMNFSGGQRQRIALARALIKDSPILILDDTFSALDYKTDKNIRKKLAKHKKNQTKIFISQRISSIINADKIIVIDKGKIIGMDTHNNLVKNNDLYSKLYETQLAGDDI